MKEDTKKTLELYLRKKYRSAGSTPITIHPPTQGGISFYEIGSDPRHAARLRGNKARGTQSSSQRKVIK